MLWGCIVYLPEFLIAELGFFLVVGLLYITSRFRLVKEQVMMEIIVLKGDSLYISRRKGKEGRVLFDTLL